jgi:hypothetical protein
MGIRFPRRPYPHFFDGRSSCCGHQPTDTSIGRVWQTSKLCKGRRWSRLRRLKGLDRVCRPAVVGHQRLDEGESGAAEATANLVPRFYAAKNVRISTVIHSFLHCGRWTVQKGNSAPQDSAISDCSVGLVVGGASRSSITKIECHDRSNE